MSSVRPGLADIFRRWSPSRGASVHHNSGTVSRPRSPRSRDPRRHDHWRRCQRWSPAGPPEQGAHPARAGPSGARPGVAPPVSAPELREMPRVAEARDPDQKRAFAACRTRTLASLIIVSNRRASNLGEVVRFPIPRTNWQLSIGGPPPAPLAVSRRLAPAPPGALVGAGRAFWQRSA